MLPEDWKNAGISSSQQTTKFINLVNYQDYRQIQLFKTNEHAAWFTSSAELLPNSLCSRNDVKLYLLKIKAVWADYRYWSLFFIIDLNECVLFSTSHRLILPQASVKVSSSMSPHWLVGPKHRLYAGIGQILEQVSRQRLRFHVSQQQCAFSLAHTALAAHARQTHSLIETIVQQTGRACFLLCLSVFPPSLSRSMY